tara:strand:+ start:13649 stop:13981 length:333 start_codon:yes stop_codon:yes gene_type:complete
MKKRSSRPVDAKSIHFPSLEELHVNLMLKLNFDDMTKFFFFNEYIKGYITEDASLMPYINKIKEKSMLARKFRLKKARVLRAQEEEIKNKFALNTDEIEDIFDFIEREEP